MTALQPTLISDRVRSIPTGIIVAAALAVLVAILWLPFGLNVGFTGDDWILFQQVDEGDAMSHTSATRLFTPVPFILAYNLNPGHFSAINLFLALLLVAKGYLCYAILRRLHAATPLAFAAAVLSILMPADTGIFYLGAMTIQFALVCYLLALYLLLVAWERGWMLALLGMGFVQLGCVGIYESVYPLIVFTPLVLLLVRRGTRRRLIRYALLWYAVPFLYALWYAFIVLSFPRALQYQGSLIESPTIAAIITSLFNIYGRHFVGGWLDSAGVSPAEHLLLGALAGVIAFAVCVALLRRARLDSEPRLTLKLAVGGLAVIGLGVALYLPTSLRNETLRTFYFSSVGAAVALAAVLWWGARRPLIFAALVGVFAGVGMLRLLDQHRSYYDESERQQAALTELARALPSPEPGSGIVVVDETPDGALANLIHGPHYLEYMLPTLYDDCSLEAELCLPGEFGSDEAARCRFNDTGLVIESWRTFQFDQPYDQLIFVRYDGSCSVIDDLAPYVGRSIPAYQPEARYQPGGIPPARIADLFGSDLTTSASSP